MYNQVEVIATILFASAVFHTFLCGRIRRFAGQYDHSSWQQKALHFLGEVELVFVFWAALLLIAIFVTKGGAEATSYLRSRNFTEAIFVFVIMVVAATKPLLRLLEVFVAWVSWRTTRWGEWPVYVSSLVLGPFLGSWITEPAAMTVTALILRDRYFKSDQVSDRFKYFTLAVLFVNISIGGVFTPYAAPPVLMVASAWQWNLKFMILNFGWKAILATLINASLAAFILRVELVRMSQDCLKQDQTNLYSQKDVVPMWLTFLHLLFLGMVVYYAHEPTLFVGCFLIFYGIYFVTTEYQERLKIKESLLVASFLAGLIVLGGLQAWWLQPLLFKLNESTLFVGATVLTAVTDNAALTYLGSQVEGLSASLRYSLVAGAVAGGGLTVIANAPNPAGFALLQPYFGESGIEPLRLFLSALLPTIIAMICFWFF